uniref:Dehydrogenase/reductase 7 like 1 n=1 Tax=Mus spicilegus TaxID=10103 RepID=A0A8C6HZS9_MUSSI
MDIEFWILALCALLLPAFGLLSFLRLDSDLTLLWASWMGRRPEQALTGMVVWVTGASSGIGEELAFQLSKLGVSLVLSDRRAQELERVKRRCLDSCPFCQRWWNKCWVVIK